MKLAVVGTGYVGLVSGACFSDLGHEVICVDIDASKIDALNRGEIPIYEPGLEEMVRHSVEQGLLRFTTDVRKAIRESLILFVAVGTPPKEDGTADLRYVMDVARSVGQHINGYKVIVDKSTVPVGTARQVRDAVQEEMRTRGIEHEFDVVSNPEFLKEGAAIEDFMHPDRVVIGCDNDRVRVLMEELYAHFARNGRPILTMSPESAEMTKYAANAMLATKISFINEMAQLCEKLDANIDDVRNGIGSDRRIGYEFINPGIGYGGSCFPKDVKAIIQMARSADSAARLLESVELVNEDQKRCMIDRVHAYFGGDVAGKTFALWGLAFKPETDDVREAPALLIAEALLAGGAAVRAFDPKAQHQAELVLGKPENLCFCDNYYDALEGADALILCTEWPFFRNPDLNRMRKAMKAPVVFDGRNVFAPPAMAAGGFDYFSIGREAVRAYST